MNAPIRFAPTADGARVAFTSQGSGHPLIDISGVLYHDVSREWETVGVGGWYEALAENFEFVRFDQRGAPNSDPFPPDQTYEEWTTDDLWAVVNALGLREFGLMAMSADGVRIAQLAADHPKAVSHLIFLDPVTEPPFQEMNWDEYLNYQEARARSSGSDLAYIQARMALPDGRPEHVESFSALVRSNLPNGRALFKKQIEARRRLDFTPLLPRITAKALVVAFPGSGDGPGRTLAGGIAGAEFVRWPGHPAFSDVSEHHRRGAAALARFVYGVEKPGTQAKVQARPVGALSKREAEILALVAAGHSNAEIGASLVLSAGTVQRHVANIYAKLGIHNRVQATAAYFGVANEGAAARIT